MMPRLLTILGAALCLCPVMPLPAQTGDLYGIHDPTLIRQGEYIYLYSTGSRPGEMLRARRSTDLLAWERIVSPFSELPSWTREAVPMVRSLWAPDVRFFNGRYHLYYSASSFGSNTSAIGLATNVTLDPEDPDYEWVDHGPVITSGSEEHRHFNAIDPHVLEDVDGQVWMSFGSFWSGIKLIRLDPETGGWHPEDREIRSLATRATPGAVEAPCLCRQGGHYYLFVSFDFCCRGVESTYKIMVGRADRVTGPYVDRDGTPLTEGGGTLVLEGEDRIRGPGHNDVFHDGDAVWLVHHFYDADARGRSSLQIRPLTWDADGWPHAGEPLALPDPSTLPPGRP